MDQHSFHEFCPQPETGGPYGRLEVVLLAERWRKASRRFAAEMSSLLGKAGAVVHRGTEPGQSGRPLPAEDSRTGERS